MCLSTPECEALNISRKKIPTKQEYCCILTGPHQQRLAKLKTWAPICSNGLNIQSRYPQTEIDCLALFVGSVEISMILTSRNFYTAQLFDHNQNTALVNYGHPIRQRTNYYIARKRSAQGHKIYLELFRQGICPIGIGCLTFPYYHQNIERK